MKVGVLGGSFNPVHYGHLYIAQKVLPYVDEVWLMPCYHHPFGKENISFHHRYNMIKLALEELGNKRIKVSDFEKRKNKNSATIDTIKELEKTYHGCKFYWIIGSDVVSELKKWKNYRELMKKAKFLIVKRIGYEPEFIPKNSVYLKEVKTSISSSEIRDRIRRGESVDGFLPDKVISYIEKNNLYLLFNCVD